MAQILGVPVQFFFEDLPQQAVEEEEGFGETREQTAIMDFLGSSEGLQLNRYFAQIKDARIRRSIIDLVRSLSQSESN